MDDDFEDVLNLPRPQHAHREIAIFGGPGEDDLRIAGGYLRVAEIAARHWIEHGPDDGLPIPILYNYRHGIELSLKWLIRLAARCLVQGGYTKENLSPEKLDEKLRTHNIKKLADRLDRYMQALEIDAPNNRIDEASRELLALLDSEDETGETYRYAIVGVKDSKRRARPKQVDINFYEQVNELHKLANLMHGGYSTYLDEYAQLQADYLSDMRGGFL
ncbi:hypothetical protein ACFU8I_16265 [Streptomyces sp. NPDC057540]|uniref:hypothetical protein n=1 Tax=Streptomyces sp. NPDC057540 TaxID=3346160 RepID=UPI00369745FE